MGNPADGVDARGIQPFYTGILARMTGLQLAIGIEDGEFRFSATPAAAVAAPAADAAPYPELEQKSA